MTAPLRTEALEVSAAEAIVRPTSLSLWPGEPLTILGETGSGKSLLAQAVMGTLPSGVRARGKVWIAGRDTAEMTPSERRALWGRTITLLPQEPWLALDPTMRAGAQVAESWRHVRGLASKAARAEAEAALSQLGLNGAGRKLPGELSGGMAQRVAFAAARAGGAGIVIADEPTKGLDASRRGEVVALLRRELSATGGLLTITHDIAVARQLGGRVAVMLDGEILEEGPAEQVLATPRSDYVRRLVAADPEAWPEPPRPVPGETVLTAEDLGKARGGRQLFRGLDLAVGAGEILGVTGPSGCGKSTLGDLLLGLLPPDEGRVRPAPGLERLRFQKLYQDPPAAFAPRLTLRRALGDLLRRHRLPWSAVEELMPRLRLSPALLDRRPGEVSGGELQRFAILRVLLLRPAFLFADEPTSRLDPITQQETMALLVALAREQRCALLLVSHDAALVRKLADRQVAL